MTPSGLISRTMIYIYDFQTGEFSGPIFIAAQNGLQAKVDALHFEEALIP